MPVKSILFNATNNALANALNNDLTKALTQIFSLLHPLSKMLDHTHARPMRNFKANRRSTIKLSVCIILVWGLFGCSLSGQFDPAARGIQLAEGLEQGELQLRLED